MPNLELGVYTLKKTFFVVIVLAVLISACAPASAPETEIIPTTSAPVVTEAPVSLPEVTRVKFVYEYNYVPVSWVQNYMEEETVSFYSKGTEWSTKSLSPIFTYHGELFPIGLDFLVNQTGECGINTYHLTRENGDKEISVKPICRIPSSNETAIASARLSNCFKDMEDKLTCTFDGEFGFLMYRLNSQQNVFEYKHVNEWESAYEAPMAESLTILGFEPPSPEFLQSTEEGKIYTITK